MVDPAQEHGLVLRPLPGGPFNAITWGWTGVRGTWTTAAAASSLAEMAALGANWVVLAYAALQDTAQSTVIHWSDPPTEADGEIIEAARLSRELGMRVCLKPIVNCADGTWRAHIGFFDVDVPGEPTWDEWFDAYDEFILHHAALAEHIGADLFSIGCEMVRADARASRWRDLAAKVRAIYSGPITYNCDKYQEDRVTWWDAVDVISSSGYYPTGTWHIHLDRIAPVVARHSRPFVFLEAGCPSRDTSPARPNDGSLPGAPSGAAQADYLDELLGVVDATEWVQGAALWDWPATLYPADTAASNTDNCMFAKPGAEVVRRHFTRSSDPS